MRIDIISDVSYLIFMNNDKHFITINYLFLYKKKRVSIINFSSSVLLKVNHNIVL